MKLLRHSLFGDYDSCSGTTMQSDKAAVHLGLLPKDFLWGPTASINLTDILPTQCSTHEVGDYRSYCCALSILI